MVEEKINHPPEVTKEEKPTKKTKEKFNKKNVIIAGVIAFILIIVGCGFYNGIVVSNYAKEIKTIMVESNKKWSQSQIDQKNQTTDKMVSIMKVVQQDSADQLKKLNSLSAPSKDKDLETKTKEYFQIASEASKNLLAILDYVKVLETSNNDMKNASGGSSSSIDEFTALFTKFHNTFSTMLTSLRAANPPEAYKSFNSQYIAAIDRMDKAVVKALNYAKANQIDQISSVTSEFDSALSELSQISLPDQKQAVQDVLSDSKMTKLKNLPSEIENEADKLSKTIFCLF